MKFEVTLAALRKAGACYSGYNTVVRMLQDKPFSEADACRESYIRFAHKEPISLASIAENNGIDDAIWSLRCIASADRDIRLFAIWCARQVQHLMSNPRSIEALDVAERFANGDATDEELREVRDVAYAATDAAADAAAAAAAAYADAAYAAAYHEAQKAVFIDMCNGKAPWQV